MNQVYSLTFDSSNALYITDYGNNRIQKWIIGASSGSTMAGQASGTSGASSTALSQPVGIVLDSSNNMYFSDRGNARVMFWANGASSGSVIAGITGEKVDKLEVQFC
jgi:DNA-binding beta-propeller fold protein YncE